MLTTKIANIETNADYTSNKWLIMRTDIYTHNYDLANQIGWLIMRTKIYIHNSNLANQMGHSNEDLRNRITIENGY